MNLHDTLSQLSPGSNSHKVTVPSNWLQGRTCYGGLSSSLAYQAAKLAGGDDLPPLKSAQVAFAGPLSGELEIRSEILRRGRNTAFIKSEIACGGDVGLSCTFIFMTDRQSHVAHCDLEKPDMLPFPNAGDLRSGPPEFFTSNMQYTGKRLELGQNTPRLCGWQRITERDGLDPIAELICIGDALPPSAMGLMTEKGMVSSMNWQFNLLTQDPATRDGWWYLDSHTHHAANGASSQNMAVWNADGEPVLFGMQSVAIFS